MANKKISELTAATTTNSTDETVLAVSGTSKKITMANLVNGIVKYLTTSAKGMTGVDDTNGNEVVKFTGVASAVNEVTFTNAASGSSPSATATGGDTNIDLALQGKGTGQVKFGTANIKLPNSDGTAGTLLVTDGSGSATFRDQYLKTGLSTFTNTITITHNLGKTPLIIRLTCMTPASGGSVATHSYATYSNSTSNIIAIHSFASPMRSYSATGNNIMVVPDLDGTSPPATHYTIGTITSNAFTLTRVGSSTSGVLCIWEVL